MRGSSAQKIKLTSYDDLFGGEGQASGEAITSVPREAAVMFHFPEMPEQPLFTGFKVDDFITTDKPTRYGKNNHFTYAEQPTVVGQGCQRKINIYCAIPAA